jgi:hypothetical protein
MPLWNRLKLIDNDGTANSAPSLGSDGVDLVELRDPATGKLPTSGTIVIRGTRTSGSATGVFRLWFYFTNVWCPAGNGTDANKGKLNDGAAVGEVTANEMRHAQPVVFPEHATRAYLELLSPGGTGLKVNAWLNTKK